MTWRLNFNRGIGLDCDAGNDFICDSDNGVVTVMKQAICVGCSCTYNIRDIHG